MQLSFSPVPFHTLRIPPLRPFHTPPLSLSCLKHSRGRSQKKCVPFIQTEFQVHDKSPPLPNFTFDSCWFSPLQSVRLDRSSLKICCRQSGCLNSLPLDVCSNSCCACAKLAMTSPTMIPQKCHKTLNLVVHEHNARVVQG